MAVNIITGGDRRFEAPAGGTFSAGDFVKWSSNTIVVCSDGVQPCGIAVNDCVSGDTAVVIQAPCVVRTTAAAQVNLNYGDACYVASATTVDAGAQGNYACGYVVNTNPATAGEVEMDLVASHHAAEGPAHA